MNKKFEITIPEITDATLQLFVNDKFLGNVTVEQLNKIRVDMVKYINETGDTSILDTFYLIGHKDTNTVMGEEIKITMEENGNLSDLPWEMCHVRRAMMKLMEMERIKVLGKNSFK
jgi:hypothetical protein